MEGDDSKEEDDLFEKDIHLEEEMNFEESVSKEEIIYEDEGSSNEDDISSTFCFDKKSSLNASFGEIELGIEITLIEPLENNIKKEEATVTAVVNSKSEDRYKRIITEDDFVRRSGRRRGIAPEFGNFI